MLRSFTTTDRWMRQTLTAALLSLVPMAAVAQETVDVDLEIRRPDNAVPRGDFGDAPDGELARYQTPYHTVIGNFPTRHFTANSRYGLNGGQTRRATQAWLGATVSLERGARDTLDPDTVENLVDDDRDDSLRFGPCIQGVPSINPPTLDTTLGIDVTVAAGAPDQTRYINVLIDHNHDGVWANQPGLTEWVAIDIPVNVTPGTTQTITVGPYVNLLDPAASWTRISLTNNPVTGTFADDGSGWDGSGRFKHGEIEDYLLDNSVAAAYADAYQAKSDTDIAADLAGAFDMADPADAATLVAIDTNVSVTAVAAALATAQAEASAAATAVASAQASAAAAASAVAAAQSSAGAVAAACISCPCATLCASAGAGATASVEAAVRAQAAADAAVLAAVAAEAQASAQVAALAIAVTDLNVQVSAFAAARASAQASAGAFATAYADAQAYALAYANAMAIAASASCTGDATAFSSALATAYAAAYASANAEASAWASASASASAWSEVRVAYSIMVRIQTLSATYASSSAFASSMSLSFAATAAEAEAAAEAAALSLTEAFATVVGACGGDCCDNGGGSTTSSRPDDYRDGTSTRTSSRSSVGISSVLLHYVATSTEIVGFTWQAVEANPDAFGGSGDFLLYDPAMVQGGNANEGNAMMEGIDLPVNRTPVTDDCGNPIQVQGQPLFNYEMVLPAAIPTIPGEEMYFTVRGVGGPNYQSNLVSSHTEPGSDRQPTFFLAPDQGIFNAVPVQSVDDCDRDYVANPMEGGNGGSTLRASGDEDHSNHGHEVSRKEELNTRNLMRSLATGTSGGTHR